MPPLRDVTPWGWLTRSRSSTPRSAANPPQRSDPTRPSPPPLGVEAMFQQDPNAVGGSLALSALCAVIPLAVLFIMIGGLKIRAWVSGLVSLVVALVVAVALFGMPFGQSLSAAADGGLFGF